MAELLRHCEKSRSWASISPDAPLAWTTPECGRSSPATLISTSDGDSAMVFTSMLAMSGSLETIVFHSLPFGPLRGLVFRASAG